MHTKKNGRNKEIRSVISVVETMNELIRWEWSEAPLKRIIYNYVQNFTKYSNNTLRREKTQTIIEMWCFTVSMHKMCVFNWANDRMWYNAKSHPVNNLNAHFPNKLSVMLEAVTTIRCLRFSHSMYQIRIFCCVYFKMDFVDNLENRMSFENRYCIVGNS